MGLFDSIGSYIDARKRVAARNLRDVAADPGGMFGTWGNQVREDLTSNMQQMGAGVTDRGLLSQSIAAAMGPAGNAPMGLLGHTVYHGSPHKFDKFDASKIGTGEGAQAYGHGLYLAENPNVATGYADKLSQVSVDGGWSKTPRVATYGSRRVDTMAPSSSLSPGELAVTYANIEGGKANGLLALREMASDPYIKDRERYKKAAEILMRLDPKKIGAEYGNLYKVDLPDEWLPKMLDWDKPLSQQPEAFARLKDSGIINDKSPPHQKSGKATPSALLQMPGEVQSITQQLVDAGIPGIRYLDGGSRAAGDGTYNYVVFPGMEGLLKILERQ